MALPLRNVQTTLSASFTIGCIATSCGCSLDEDNVWDAFRMNERWSDQEIELTNYPKRLRRLAHLLLCPDHEEQLGEAAAQAWRNPRPRDDLFQLFGLDTDPDEWSCIAKRCCVDDFFDTDDRWNIHNIINDLAHGVVDRECLSSEKRTEMVRDLVSRLHCEDHRTHGMMKRIRDKWNVDLAATFASEGSGSCSDTSSCSKTEESTTSRSPCQASSKSLSGVAGGQGLLEDVDASIQKSASQPRSQEPDTRISKTPEPQQLPTPPCSNQRSESSSSERSFSRNGRSNDAMSRNTATPPSMFCSDLGIQI